MALRRNILLFHQGALGDFVVTWPLAVALGRIYPQNRIFYVTSGQKGTLAEKVLRVESVDVEGGWHQLFSDEPKLAEPAERLLTGAHTVISFVASADDVWSRNVRKMAPQATLVTLQTKPPEDFQGHVTEFLLEQIKPWPVIRAAAEQILQSVAARGIGFPRPAPDAVVIHPGAGSPAKCWPVERFVTLAQRVRQGGLAVRALVGEVERERWPAEQISRLRSVAELHEPRTLVELADQLARARAFIGNDSGPGHLAGIISIPTISIFGPADPTRWKPLGPRGHVVGGEWDAIKPDDVFERVRALMGGAD
jgi:heptosyltransferase-3